MGVRSRRTSVFEVVLPCSEVTLKWCLGHINQKIHAKRDLPLSFYCIGISVLLNYIFRMLCCGEHL